MTSLRMVIGLIESLEQMPMRTIILNERVEEEIYME
jgi:hypothetical protein